MYCALHLSCPLSKPITVTELQTDIAQKSTFNKPGYSSIKLHINKTFIKIYDPHRNKEVSINQSA
jgi:hypothetical protein